MADRKIKNDYEYIGQYVKENMISVAFRLSRKYDADLIDHLERLSESKAAYIKRLIREDMEKQK